MLGLLFRLLGPGGADEKKEGALDQIAPLAAQILRRHDPGGSKGFPLQGLLNQRVGSAGIPGLEGMVGTKEHHAPGIRQGENVKTELLAAFD